MTLIHNTTPIPERALRLIIDAVIPKDIPPVNSISLRNKQENKTHGNWGYFLSGTYEITLCVPRLIKNISGERFTTHIHFYFDDEYDFLATVIGHEYKHAWQWIHEKHLFHLKQYLEVEAEKYEIVALDKWKEAKKSIDPDLLKHNPKELSYAAYRNRK